jgi:hypothetical protein
MPLSAGMLAKNVLKASSPPADAPMPTINGASGGGAAIGFCRCLGEFDFVTRVRLGRVWRDLAFLCGAI